MVFDEGDLCKGAERLVDGAVEVDDFEEVDFGLGVFVKFDLHLRKVQGVFWIGGVEGGGLLVVGGGLGDFTDFEGNGACVEISFGVISAEVDEFSDDGVGGLVIILVESEFVELAKDGGIVGVVILQCLEDFLRFPHFVGIDILGGGGKGFIEFFVVDGGGGGGRIG